MDVLTETDLFAPIRTKSSAKQNFSPTSPSPPLASKAKTTMPDAKKAKKKTFRVKDKNVRARVKTEGELARRKADVEETARVNAQAMWQEKQNLKLHKFGESKEGVDIMDVASEFLSGKRNEEMKALYKRDWLLWMDQLAELGYAVELDD